MIRYSIYIIYVNATGSKPGCYNHPDIFLNKPRYDEYTNDLEEQSFESTYTKLFSSGDVRDIYEGNESDDVELPDQSRVCFF